MKVEIDVHDFWPGVDLLKDENGQDTVGDVAEPARTRLSSVVTVEQEVRMRSYIGVIENLPATVPANSDV